MAGPRREVTAKSQASGVESSPREIDTPAERDPHAVGARRSPAETGGRRVFLSLVGGRFVEDMSHHVVPAVAVPCAAAHSGVVGDSVGDLAAQEALLQSLSDEVRVHVEDGRGQNPYEPGSNA